MIMDIELIKKLREETGAGVMDVKSALAESDGDTGKAKEILMQKGMARAEKRAEREARNGLIHSYIHGNGDTGVLLELNCETSFVGKTPEFEELAHELALQIVSMNPDDVEGLLSQDYIRDTKKKVSDLIKELVAKTGENIELRRFVRYELGE
ncbi:translation elongation factor Ts [candidate division WWE3 bacterium]|uniref:Elongation factor Ts n=1 Tax=candidate division WWE3 bacterium TaxID=2053526 RepID=A0A955LK05_UNCKA|nr:translation elongation factor Ts [candidate division WWE3 bacterium]